MRVLHFCKNSPDSVGGMEQMIDQLARGTAQLGVEVDVLHLTRGAPGPPVEMHGYRVHRVPLNFEVASTAFSIAALRAFSRLARDATVVHHHFPWPFSDIVHFAAQVRRPSLVTYHSDIIRQKFLLNLYRPLQDSFLASVDRIVATSPNYFTTSAVLQRFAEKVEVIPIGLDSASYPEADEERIRRWRLVLGGRFFLFVGALRYYKGLHILIEAAKGLDCTIAIVGAGDIESALKAQAASLSLSNVKFLGQLPEIDKVALLTSCMGVVFPSHLRSEAFGVTLLEGAMYGKPLISSEIGTGTTFVNIDGNTGLVIPPGDVHALQTALRYLWTHPDEAARMGRRARRRQQRLFTAEMMSRRYVALYEEIAREAATAGNRLRR